MKLTKIIFLTCLTATIALLVGGFIVPPTGVIDGSVLAGGSLLFGFATLATAKDVVNGRTAKLTHGNTALELGDND